MRYIGNKENIIDKIDSILIENNVMGKSFFDFFSGTTNVARFYKTKGLKVVSSDIMFLSYCMQKAYIENNEEPQFKKLLRLFGNIENNTLFSSPLEKITSYLDSLPLVSGFIYQNYTPGGTSELASPRFYFKDENGQKIDAIRQKIEEWKNEDLITENEYFILITCLVETVSFYANIAGVYAAFQKHWDPRAVKDLKLRTIKTFTNNQINEVYNADSMSLLDKIHTDILYLDPPYNERQYAPNYHLLETIAKYDNPEIHGVTGIRNYSNQKSRFCNAITALQDLEKIANEADYKFLVLSYNSEGIMEESRIIETLQHYGTVKLEQFEYTRFKSNNNGLAKTKKHVFEQLYILEKK
jgi:adenine-specific DNA-methyltransferase